MKTVALVPARGGSERVPKKNIRELGGHPLLAYTISAALESGEFDKVLVSSDDKEILNIAQEYGADVVKRPADYATSTSPDIEWVRHALWALRNSGEEYDCFSILRPTSPFRKPETIRRAMNQWREGNGVTAAFSSLRAVERVTQHPGKMWTINGDNLVPVLMQPMQPWHDSQMKSLPEVYVQNASLEIAWVSTVDNTGTISGQRVMAFITTDEEGFDINNSYDWKIAEEMLADGSVTLPEVRVDARSTA